MMTELTYKTNPKPGVCAAMYCKNKSGGSQLCGGCRKKKSRLADPMKYAYDCKKDNARRKGKPFTISFEYFKKFCYRYNYIVTKGTSKLSYGIDCKIAELGYVPGNIQALPNCINSKKHTKKVTYDWICKEFRAIGLTPPPEDNFDEGFNENEDYDTAKEQKETGTSIIEPGFSPGIPHAW